MLSIVVMINATSFAPGVKGVLLGDFKPKRLLPKMFAMFVSIVLALSLLSQPAYAIRYVTEDGSGNQDGSSWENSSSDLQAMIMQAAKDAASSESSDVSAQVWLAAGTYSPKEMHLASNSDNLSDFGQTSSDWQDWSDWPGGSDWSSWTDWSGWPSWPGGSDWSGWTDWSAGNDWSDWSDWLGWNDWSDWYDGNNRPGWSWLAWLLPQSVESGGDARDASFVLPGGVSLFGGFAGGEQDLNERDLLHNKTVLSGDIGQKNQVDDNAYHVLVVMGESSLPLLNNAAPTGEQFVRDEAAPTSEQPVRDEAALNGEQPVRDEAAPVAPSDQRQPYVSEFASEQNGLLAGSRNLIGASLDGTVVDGLTVADGNANGLGVRTLGGVTLGRDSGAGVALVGSGQVELKNLIFANNFASTGAIDVLTSAEARAVMENCRLSDEVGDFDGVSGSVGGDASGGNSGNVGSGSGSGNAGSGNGSGNVGSGSGSGNAGSGSGSGNIGGTGTTGGSGSGTGLPDVVVPGGAGQAPGGNDKLPGGSGYPDLAANLGDSSSIASSGDVSGSNSESDYLLESSPGSLAASDILNIPDSDTPLATPNVSGANEAPAIGADTKGALIMPVPIATMAFADGWAPINIVLLCGNILVLAILIILLVSANSIARMGTNPGAASGKNFGSLFGNISGRKAGANFANSVGADLSGTDFSSSVRNNYVDVTRFAVAPAASRLYTRRRAACSLSAIMTFLATIIFIATQNTTLPAKGFDVATLWLLALTLVNVVSMVIAIISPKQLANDDDAFMIEKHSSGNTRMPDEYRSVESARVSTDLSPRQQKGTWLTDK